MSLFVISGFSPSLIQKKLTPLIFLIFFMMEEGYNYVKKAEENLENAQEALFKPQEDIVSFVVCKNSQYAILNYLRGFLERKGFETHDHETIRGLFKRCRNIEPRFNQIKINEINKLISRLDIGTLDRF